MDLFIIRRGYKKFENYLFQLTGARAPDCAAKQGGHYCYSTIGAVS